MSSTVTPINQIQDSPPSSEGSIFLVYLIFTLPFVFALITCFTYIKKQKKIVEFQPKKKN